MKKILTILILMMVVLTVISADGVTWKSESSFIKVEEPIIGQYTNSSYPDGKPSAMILSLGYQSGTVIALTQGNVLVNGFYSPGDLYTMEARTSDGSVVEMTGAMAKGSNYLVIEDDEAFRKLLAEDGMVNLHIDDTTCTAEYWFTFRNDGTVVNMFM